MRAARLRAAARRIVESRTAHPIVAYGTVTYRNGEIVATTPEIRHPSAR